MQIRTTTTAARPLWASTATSTACPRSTTARHGGAYSSPESTNSHSGEWRQHRTGHPSYASIMHQQDSYHQGVQLPQTHYQLHKLSFQHRYRQLPSPLVITPAKVRAHIWATRTVCPASALTTSSTEAPAAYELKSFERYPGGEKAYEYLMISCVAARRMDSLKLRS